MLLGKIMCFMNWQWIKGGIWFYLFKMLKNESMGKQMIKTVNFFKRKFVVYLNWFLWLSHSNFLKEKRKTNSGELKGKDLIRTSFLRYFMESEERHVSDTPQSWTWLLLIIFLQNVIIIAIKMTNLLSFTAPTVVGL